MFLPPTALKLMRIADVKHSGVKLRSIFTGGESLGGELLGWVRETFGIDAHEVFGQTECNLVIGSNANLFPIRPGAMGRATPGFDVRIVNDKGEELPRGTRGVIGVRQPCPCTMIEYWRNPEATAKKYAGEFLLTGDLGVQDEDGYFWYVSREDDVITTAGYRVGPSEIEHTLMNQRWRCRAIGRCLFDGLKWFFFLTFDHHLLTDCRTNRSTRSSPGSSARPR